ncbi:MAG: hypothetical protein K2L92_04430 [Muribaculaceae bacterium]|nr:hypothetical protein [Muribaculaceae bacterium]MDE6564057.1 hypothetical protein [Muribaculaceae bacterium]
MKTVILAILMLLVCIVLLGIKVLFIKGARFPSGHAGASPHLRKKGIGCATDERNLK